MSLGSRTSATSQPSCPRSTFAPEQGCVRAFRLARVVAGVAVTGGDTRLQCSSVASLPLRRGKLLCSRCASPELRALEAAQLPAPPLSRCLLRYSWPSSTTMPRSESRRRQRIRAATVKTRLFASASKTHDSDSADGNNDSSWFCATAVAQALLRLGRTQQMTVSFWCRPLAVAGSDSSPLSETQMVVSSQRSYRNNDPHLSTTFCVDIVPLTHYERYLSYDEDDKEEENDNDDGKKEKISASNYGSLGIEYLRAVETELQSTLRDSTDTFVYEDALAAKKGESFLQSFGGVVLV